MLSRAGKRVFYTVAGPLMRLNAEAISLFGRRWRTPLRVQLGPGQANYIDGWVNVDANMFTAKCDVWADLRRKLPFPDSTVDAFYSHHVIEHLPDIPAHLRDVFRCLKPGGVYRVGGPNGDSAMLKFVAGDVDWFSDFPDQRVSIGGRLDNFILCRQEHLAILTHSYLQELMTQVGFVGIRSCLPTRETGDRATFAPCLARESESDFVHPHTIIVEATKPGTRD